MRRISIIHFSPLEMYPPVMNWLNFLASQQISERYTITVYTSEPPNRESVFTSGDPSIKIVRLASFSTRSSIARYWNYFKFYLLAIAGLISKRPDTVLYYETLSALPAVLYKKWVNRKSALFIHYHEYTTAQEYAEGMIINRFSHKLEKKIYSQCTWISHTNSDRLEKFLIDNPTVLSSRSYLLPNYPPSSWLNKKQKSKLQSPVKMVYVGALSIDTMFTRELSEWVISKKGTILFDIYSSNITEEAKNYLDSLDKNVIRFFGSINYYSLPKVLQYYDIGVILYKGHIENYIYNAPNKLFEYLACGLDVWFPDVMKSSWDHVTKGVYPKVVPINFNSLDQLNYSYIIDRSNDVFNDPAYNCEMVLDKLWAKMQAYC